MRAAAAYAGFDFDAADTPMPTYRLYAATMLLPVADTCRCLFMFAIEVLLMPLRCAPALQCSFKGGHVAPHAHC